MHARGEAKVVVPMQQHHRHFLRPFRLRGGRREEEIDIENGALRHLLAHVVVPDAQRRKVGHRAQNSLPKSGRIAGHTRGAVGEVEKDGRAPVGNILLIRANI